MRPRRRSRPAPRPPGPHQVQRGLVGGATADDHRHVQVVDELLEIQWGQVRRDMLGRHGGASDDEEVHAGIDHGLRVRLGVLRRQGARRRHPGLADLGHSFADQLGFDRFGVDRLHRPGGFDRVVDRNDLLEQRLRVLVPGPQTLELSTPRPPSWPSRIAVAGDITESIGALISGKAKLYASSFQARLTSSSPRVRRDGTMEMSSKAKACCARLLRPISNMG